MRWPDRARRRSSSAAAAAAGPSCRSSPLPDSEPPFDEDRAEVVDVGERRAGDDEVAEPGEEGVSVVPREMGLGVEPGGGGAGETVRLQDGAGIVLGAVDAVGVAGDRRDARPAAERDA